MSTEQIFDLANALVMPFWLLLVLAPRWRPTQLLVHSALVPAVLGVVYTFMLTSGLSGGPANDEPAFSLAWLLIAFQVPEALVAGWIHYLVFDLFVGAWEVRDAQRLGIAHLAVVPCLFLTLMAGPAGLLLYLVLRFALRSDLLLHALEPGEGAPASPSTP